ncbi:MAG: DUF86 domain-containing protein [Nanoarchaeota archaeon]
MTKHSNIPYLNHIIEAISDINESVKEITKEQFLVSKDIRDASIRRLELIGEAVKNISSDLKSNHPEIAWSKIAGTRDKVIHNYFGVNLNIIWDIIKTELPELKRKLDTIMKTDTEE